MKMIRVLVYEGDEEFIDMHVERRWVKDIEGPFIDGQGNKIIEKSIKFEGCEESKGGEPGKNKTSG